MPTPKIKGTVCYSTLSFQNYRVNSARVYSRQLALLGGASDEIRNTNLKLYTHFTHEFDIFIIFKIDNFDQKKILNKMKPTSKNGHTAPLRKMQKLIGPSFTHVLIYQIYIKQIYKKYYNLNLCSLFYHC